MKLLWSALACLWLLAAHDDVDPCDPKPPMVLVEVVLANGETVTRRLPMGE